jgi:multimeric flavodoxin WrbA
LKIVGIVASPRRDGNTADMTNHALECLQKKGVETQVFNLFDFKITPCGVRCNIECYEHTSVSERVCPVDKEDDLLELVRIVNDADGVILATPCYGFDVPAHLKAYLERSELKEFDNKVICIIAIASLGGIHTVSTITSNLIHHSHSVVAGWAILTRFYPRRGQAMKDENNRKLVEKLAEQMYSALQEKGNRKKRNETE